MTTSLSPGPAHTLVQDEVYALPPCKVMVFSDTAVEISNEATTNFVTLTGANTVGADTAAQFIRCTTANAVVSVKKL